MTMCQFHAINDKKSNEHSSRPTFLRDEPLTFEKEEALSFSVSAKEEVRVKICSAICCTK